MQGLRQGQPLLVFQRAIYSVFIALGALMLAHTLQAGSTRPEPCAPERAEALEQTYRLALALEALTTRGAAHPPTARQSR